MESTSLEPRMFRTRERASLSPLGPTRSIGAHARATPVQTGEGPALLVELAEGLLTPELAEREARGRGEVHLLAAIETGVLVDANASGSSAYRGRLRGEDARPFALFPGTIGATLGPALARARSGEAFAGSLVASLAYECARGLAAMEDVALFTPSSVVIAADGSARVRGPVLEALATSIRTTEGTRWMAYLAPELIQRSEPTSAARLFALGVMLLELCAGRALFASSGAAVRQVAEWTVSMSELAALGDGIPSELRGVLWTLLQRDPNRRASPRMIVEQLTPTYLPGISYAALIGSPLETPYFHP